MSPPVAGSDPRPPAAPRLPESLPTGPAELTDDALLEAVRLDDAGWAATDTEFAELAEVRLAGGTLAESQWYRSQWRDVAAEGTDLANATFTEGGWTRVAIRRGRLTGLSLAGARVDDLRVTDSPAGMVNLRATRLRRAVLQGCDLSGSQWNEAQLGDVAFVDCDLSEAEFSGVSCQRVLVRDCRLDRVGGLGSLRGATVESPDPAALAVQLAHELGITLR